ncbi:MAG: DUF503 domain-containing protein [Candidatus Omnitrophota bacterium]
MTIGLLQIIIRIPNSNSLKEKRMILRSLKDKIRNKYNISLAEVDAHDKWQKSVLAISKVDKERVMVDRAFCNIVDFIKDFIGVELVDYQTELF